MGADEESLESDRVWLVGDKSGVSEPKWDEIMDLEEFRRVWGQVQGPGDWVEDGRGNGGAPRVGVSEGNEDGVVRGKEDVFRRR